MEMDRHLGVPGILTFPDAPTPIGRRVFGGHLCGVGGTGFNRYRTYGMYCLVLLLGETKGRFRDKLGNNHRLKAGDVIIVFPDIPHQYGPEKDDPWEEVFIAFEGATFDNWKSNGLDPKNPVWSVSSSKIWKNRFLEILKPLAQKKDSLQNAAKIHSLLQDLLEARELTDKETPSWLESACQDLTINTIATSLEKIAQKSGVGYEKFRKIFKNSTGESPQKYRNRVRISHATTLLKRTNLTLDSIAKSLGYCDAFHFSKSFKAHYGLSPSKFRQKHRKAKPNKSGFSEKISSKKQR